MTAMKKPCINDSSFTYTGKEMSPLGLGYCANAEKVGHFMKGKDNTMWMVGMKNGMKVWNRVPTDLMGEMNAPLQKDEPVMQDGEDNEVAAEHEAGPSVPVPEPAPKKKAAPRKKKVVAEGEEEEAPKKKAAPRKKKVVVEGEEEAPKKKAAPRKKSVTPKPEEKEPKAENEHEEKEDDKEELKPKAVPKKKAAPRKKSITPKPEGPVDEENEGVEVEAEGVKKEKKTRKPTDFNLFMKYHMLQLPKEIKHKEKFQMAAKAWKELDGDAKKEVMVKVHSELNAE